MRTRRIGTFALITVMGLMALGIGSTSAVAAAPMSAATTTQALAAYTTALDAGTPSAELFAADAVLTFGDSGRQVRSQAAVAQAIAALYHGSFAGRMTITASVVGQGEAATTGQFGGTQIGEFAGLAASGGTMSVPYTAFYEFADGRITALRLDFSTAEILRQLASAPAEAAPSQWPRGTPY
jgi:predicted ester cyclase